MPVLQASIPALVQMTANFFSSLNFEQCFKVFFSGNLMKNCIFCIWWIYPPSYA